MNNTRPYLRCGGTSKPTKKTNFSCGSKIDVLSRGKWSACPVCGKWLNVPVGKKAPSHYEMQK